MKVKLFGLTIEIKKKVSLEKRLIKRYGKHAYAVALRYCKNLTEEGLEEACEIAKTNLITLHEHMRGGDLLPTRAMFSELTARLQRRKDEIKYLEDELKCLEDTLRESEQATADHRKETNRADNRVADAEARATRAEHKIIDLKKLLQRQNENVKKLIKSKNAAINNLNAQVYNDKTYKEEQSKKLVNLKKEINKLNTFIHDLERRNDEEIKQIKAEKKDADGLIEKLLIKIAEYEEAINKLNNDSITE